ncbi:hypothetical protein C8F04DRAFT_1181485 [Mycena alexandri]|uniref:Uncharacterized protein n=1 Tax=Mycena alexandri TaxID=1745969 RepID=A0AAD6T109_9AGAR|nr:hypothetical protein C8F04DRAFT_1181485 [Mycena alexandri]
MNHTQLGFQIWCFDMFKMIVNNCKQLQTSVACVQIASESGWGPAPPQDSSSWGTDDGWGANDVAGATGAWTIPAINNLSCVYPHMAYADPSPSFPSTPYPDSAALRRFKMSQVELSLEESSRTASPSTDEEERPEGSGNILLNNAGTEL